MYPQPSALVWVKENVLLSPADFRIIEEQILSWSMLRKASREKFESMGLSTAGSALLFHEIQALRMPRQLRDGSRAHLLSKSSKETETIDGNNHKQVELVGKSFITQTPFFSSNEMELALTEGEGVTILEQVRFLLLFFPVLIFFFFFFFH
jgi:hypothetical protein